MNEIKLPIHKIECFQHFNFQNATRFLDPFNFFYPVIRGIGGNAHLQCQVGIRGIPTQIAHPTLRTLLSLGNDKSRVQLLHNHFF